MRECKYCGKTFEPKIGTKLYCSQECSNMANKERVKSKVNEKIEKACECCGSTFLKTRYSKKIYCTDKCRREMQKALREAEPKKVVNKAKSLAELQREARMRGMSYGMYMASMQKGAV